MKLGIVAHIPEPAFGNPKVFTENLAKYPTRFTLLTYSHHAWPGVIKIGDPGVLRGSRANDGSVNKFAVNNLVFLTGMRIARAHGLTHVIYLEEDCRVGCKNWDERIFDEHFNIGRPLIASGTLACYNPCNHSPLSAKRWHELVSSNKRKNFPIATYGWLPAGSPGPTCLFPNGALGVYDVAWIDRLLPLDRTMEIAAMSSAWDMLIGIKVWETFQEDAFDMLGYLNCVYSGFSDLVTTEVERQAMLTSGQTVAVHQIKSSWQP